MAKQNEEQAQVERRKSVRTDEFVPLWLKAHAEGKTKREFAESIGMNVTAVSTRANLLKRTQKIELPSFRRPTRASSIDYDALRKAVKEFNTKKTA